MAEAPTDAEILQAITRRFPKVLDAGHPHFRGAARTEVRQLVRLQVVRSIETRSEGPAAGSGRVDLSDRPRYDDLAAYPVDPPKDVSSRTSLVLVKRDSEKFEDCTCDAGRVTCSSCHGRKWDECPRYVVCPNCVDADACTDCSRSAPRRSAARLQSGRKPAARKPALSPEPRVDCQWCGHEKTACRACKGRGRSDCDLCEGTGQRPCAPCDGSGKERHEPCGGKGPRTLYQRADIQQRPVPDALELPTRTWHRRVTDRIGRDGDWEELVADPGSDVVPDEVERGHRAEIAGRLSFHRDEVAREVSVKRLYLARTELLNHPHRVFYVYTGKRRLEAMWVPSRQAVQRASAAAAGALVLLVLLLVLLH